MWSEIQSAIVDSSSKSGLRIDFLSNLSAEFLGVVVGVFVSIGVATILDKMGNNRQFRPLRFRVASELARIHETMKTELAKPFRRAGNNEAPVADAIGMLDRVVEEFDFGLTPRQHSAVDAYRMKLQSLRGVAAQSLHKNSSVNDSFATAAKALRPALKRLHAGRLEEHWKEVLGPTQGKSDTKNTPAAMFNGKLPSSARETPAERVTDETG